MDKNQFFEKYADVIGAGEIFNIPGSKFAAAMSTVSETADLFDEDTVSQAQALPGKLKQYKYIPWGSDNKLPYELIDLIGKDEVMAQNKHFNVLSCYGAGLSYNDPATAKPSKDTDVRRFMLRNSMPSFYLEQATDMKYFFFAVCVVILSADGSQIVRIVHKEASNCRFAQANKMGHIEHVFYANWRNAPDENSIEVLELLNEADPWGDLAVRMGKEPGADGRSYARSKSKKFAIVVKFPTPGSRYYPLPYYSAVFRGDWYVIKQLIAKGKKAKLKNHSSVKYQVEVHRDYWYNLCKEEGITDDLKKMERIKSEKENIKNFVTGLENSDKMWITGFYTDPNGTETRMVRINVIDAGKEGGDWSEDIQEAANMLCYADNIHPNMVGAVPGKAQNNNSGSDKRELFTLKQAVETAYKHILQRPHQVVIEYNGWADKVEIDQPMILLTTLDKNTDAKQVDSNGKEGEA